MSDTLSSPSAPHLADHAALWRYTLDPFRARRRPTREVRVGDVGIGGSNPIRLQSMTVADTLDTPAVVDEICALHAAGSEIVRVTAPNRTSAENLAGIRRELARRGVHVPLVADIHFTPQAALIAALHVDKVRINPGNYADRKRFEKWEYTDAEYSEELERLEEAFRPLVLRCKERGVAMRIGTNHGSLSDRILNRYGDTPRGMVESALEFVAICEQHGYRDIVLSMKASDVKVMVQAYRLLAARLRDSGQDYPFHLGVTEAGAGLAARVKSAIGIASLLEDGIGDTVRVSLTEDSVHEIPVARALAARAASPAPSGPPLAGVPAWDPTRFVRRPTAPLGRGPARLATDQPPRIELVAELATPTVAARAGQALVEAESQPDGADLVLLAPPRAATPDEWAGPLGALALAAAARAPDARPALGLEIPIAWLDDPRVGRVAAQAWARLALVVTMDEIERLPVGLRSTLPTQYTILLPDPEPETAERAARALARRWVAPSDQPGAIGLDFGASVPGPQPVRRFLAAWPELAAPLVLRGPRGLDATPVDAHVSVGALRLAGSLGALLADGVGDALQLHAAGDPAATRRLAAEILQATRLRLSKADFIACPSCGRTQFDLQSTTARIEARLRHLKGLKIAVMGCIVNGPGEMADADFGYVGSGPGQIDLYVGHERVERHVPQQDAVDRLVALIQAHGRWIDPPASS